MDLTFILSAVIFTLLALVVATSLFGGSSSADFTRGYFGRAAEAKAGGLDPSAAPTATRNGHGPDEKKPDQEKPADDWSQLSTHDHWDVVKSVLSEESHSQPHSEELAAPVELSTSPSVPGPPPGDAPPGDAPPGDAGLDLPVDSSSEASSGRGPRSIIGLSDKELLKCAFSHPEAEGAADNPEINDMVESNNSLKYVPGKTRTNHMQTMMSRDELEEEQRVQREQLAAIFHLLKQNKETFGEVSEGDIEEQLRLYSI